MFLRKPCSEEKGNFEDKNSICMNFLWGEEVVAKPNSESCGILTWKHPNERKARGTDRGLHTTEPRGSEFSDQPATSY